MNVTTAHSDHHVAGTNAQGKTAKEAVQTARPRCALCEQPGGEVDHNSRATQRLPLDLFAAF